MYFDLIDWGVFVGMDVFGVDDDIKFVVLFDYVVFVNRIGDDF